MKSNWSDMLAKKQLSRKGYSWAKHMVIRINNTFPNCLSAKILQRKTTPEYSPEHPVHPRGP